MKKLLALVLCILMVLPTMGLAEAAPVKWSGTISVAPYMFGPYDETKDVAIKWAEDYILEKYGYDVDFEIVYIENANYTEILNTRIAGGNAPDIFKDGGTAQIDKYYAQGAIASWDVEFFKENAPDLYAFLNGGGYQGRLADSVGLFWDLATADDGKMNNIPYFDEQSAMPSKTLMYRKDWLDKLGVTEDQLPKTLDEFVALMYRFANEDPDGNGKKDTYGCSESVIRAIFGAYGSQYDTDLFWLVKEDGTLECADVSEKNKAALELCAKLYADGVLDPEFVTGENNGGYWAVNHAFINGVVGASCHASIDHYRRPAVCNDNGGPVWVEFAAINGADADVVYAPWPAGPNGDYGLEVGYAAANAGHVLNANLNNDPEKLAAIFQIMNLFTIDDELMVRTVWGIEGEHYTVNEDGSFTRLLETAAWNELGGQTLRGIYGPEKPYSEYGMFLDFYANPTITNRLNFFEKDQCDSVRRNAITALLPSTNEFKAEVSTLRSETFVNIITGAASIDSYDDYVQEWMDLGGDILTEEANAAYKK